MYAVSIDPGKHVCGWALWADRDLVDAGIWAPRAGDLILPPPLGIQAQIVYLEAMEIRGTKSKTPPVDLLAVEGAGHLFAGLLRPRRLVTWTATTWKGGVPKETHHARIRHAFEPAETAILERAIKAAPRTNAKEILDAVGIGLYGLGRTTRGGTSR